MPMVRFIFDQWCFGGSKNAHLVFLRDDNSRWWGGSGRSTPAHRFIAKVKVLFVGKNKNGRIATIWRRLVRWKLVRSERSSDVNHI